MIPFPGHSFSRFLLLYFPFFLYDPQCNSNCCVFLTTGCCPAQLDFLSTLTIILALLSISIALCHGKSSLHLIHTVCEVLAAGERLWAYWLIIPRCFAANLYLLCILLAPGSLWCFALSPTNQKAMFSWITYSFCFTTRAKFFSLKRALAFQFHCMDKSMPNPI